LVASAWCVGGDAAAILTLIDIGELRRRRP